MGGCLLEDTQTAQFMSRGMDFLQLQKSMAFHKCFQHSLLTFWIEISTNEMTPFHKALMTQKNTNLFQTSTNVMILLGVISIAPFEITLLCIFITFSKQCTLIQFGQQVGNHCL